MRTFMWVNEKARVWWPLIITVVGAMVVGTLVYVISFVAEDRRAQIRLREIAEERNVQLADIIEAERESQESRDQRLAEAVSQVREALAEELAKHHAQTNEVMARQLAEIAKLVNRPEGTPPDPVTARSQPAPAPAPSPSPTSSSPPATSSPTTAAPAPTTPDQKNCAKRPTGPRC